jgi:FixJ family two-component response regulator
MTPPVVYVVDDDDAVRDSLRVLLASDDHAVRECRSADHFLACVEPDKAGCIVLDVRMPGMDGLELQRRLTENGMEVAVVFLTGHGDVPMSASAFRSGAFDFLEKPVDADRLLATVRAALERTAHRREAGQRRVRMQTRMRSLTSREREIVVHVVAGRSSKAIARELGVSHRTVETHRARIMQKTGAISLPALVEMALVSGVAGGAS